MELFLEPKGEKWGWASLYTFGPYAGAPWLKLRARALGLSSVGAASNSITDLSFCTLILKSF